MTKPSLLELADCPFCDSADSFVERADFSGCYVICNDCSARGPVSCDETDEDAAATESGKCEPGELAARRLWNAYTALRPTKLERGESAEQIKRLLGRWIITPAGESHMSVDDLVAAIAALRATEHPHA